MSVQIRSISSSGRLENVPESGEPEIIDCCFESVTYKGE